MTRRTASDASLLAVFLMLFAAAIVFVVFHGTAVGLHDDAAHAAAADPAFRPGLGWFWAQHNEHRIPLPRLVFSFLLHTTRDFRTATVVNVFVLALSAGGLALIARRLRGRSSPADAFFPLAFFSWGHHETLLNGFQIVFVIPVAIACGTTAIFATSSGRMSARRVALVAFLALLLPLCGAPGFVHAAILAVWLGWAAFALRGAKGSDAPRTRAASAIGALAIFALCAAYFVGLRAEHPAQATEPVAILTTAGRVLGTWAGEAARTAWPWSGILMSGALAAASIACIVFARREPAHRARWYGLLAILASSALIALAIGRGRGGDGANIGFLSRYGALMLAWPSAIFVGASFLPNPRWRRGVQFALCVLAAWGWTLSVRAGNEAGASRSLTVSAMERRLSQGLSYTEIADRRPASTGEERAHFVRALRDLDRAGAAPFAHAPGRDPWLLLGHDPWTGEIRRPGRVTAGNRPVEARLHGRVDAFVVEHDGVLEWDLPERVTIVRGLCGIVPDSSATFAGLTPTLIAEILDIDGRVLDTARIEVSFDDERAVDGTRDFGLFAEQAAGRTLRLSCDPIAGVVVATPRFYWAEVRVR